jgi:hypothetical protein
MFDDLSSAVITKKKFFCSSIIGAVYGTLIFRTANSAFFSDIQYVQTCRRIHCFSINGLPRPEKKEGKLNK